MAGSWIVSKFRNMIARTDGNFAMMTAITLPVLLMAGGLALDTTNAFSMKIRLQNAVDSAALATATRLTEEEDLSADDAKAFAAQFLTGQISEDFPAFSNLAVQPTITITPVEENGRTIWSVSVAMSGSQSLTPMAGFLGQNTLTVNVVGKSVSAGEAKGSISMALVLDRSGSMGSYLSGQRKIDILKTAVGSLLDQFEETDPDQKYVRVGVAVYHSQMQGERAMSWNSDSARSLVNSLPANGGTNSAPAVAWAYSQLNSATEKSEHKAKTGQEPTKIVVFMTDGQNNNGSSDVSTRATCDNFRKKGMEVYSVAFAAPKNGRQLLSYCATSDAHYFEADNSAELIAAFESIGQKASQIVSRLTE